jgi:hypothetical protein
VVCFLLSLPTSIQMQSWVDFGDIREMTKTHFPQIYEIRE